MNNKDLIKQYVDTGLTLPEYQTSQLQNWARKTYIRKRIISGEELADYEIMLIDNDDDIWKYLMTNVKNNVPIKNSFKNLSDKFKKKLTEFYITNDITHFTNEMFNYASPEFKRKWLITQMDKGRNIISYIGNMDDDLIDRLVDITSEFFIKYGAWNNLTTDIYRKYSDERKLKLIKAVIKRGVRYIAEYIWDYTPEHLQIYFVRTLASLNGLGDDFYSQLDTKVKKEYLKIFVKKLKKIGGNDWYLLIPNEQKIDYDHFFVNNER